MRYRRAFLLACAYAISATSGFSLSGAAAQTAGSGLVYPPASTPNSFSNAFYVSTGSGLTLIGSNSSTVVLTTFSFENWYNQTNQATASLLLYINYSTAKDCSQSAGSAWLGRFDAKAGQTFQSAIPSGFTLKPPVAGQYWCLMGAVSIQGDPSSYYLPMFGYTANLISGAIPYTASPGVQALPSAVPPIAHSP